MIRVPTFDSLPMDIKLQLLSCYNTWTYDSNPAHDEAWHDQQVMQILDEHMQTRVPKGNNQAMTESPKFQVQVVRSHDMERQIQISHTTNGHQWYAWSFSNDEFLTLYAAMRQFAHTQEEDRRLKAALARSDHAGTPIAAPDAS